MDNTNDNVDSGTYKYTIFELYDLRTYTLRTFKDDILGVPINHYYWSDTQNVSGAGPYKTLWECMKAYVAEVEERKVAASLPQVGAVTSNVIKVDFKSKKRQA